LNEESLKHLAGASTVEELRRRVEALCRPFGGIKDIRLNRIGNGREYACFVELDSPDQYELMVAQLGGVNYGHCVIFRIPFNHAED
jgi:hypothetical protein